MSETEAVNAEAVEAEETEDDTAEDAPVFETPEHDWEAVMQDEDASAKLALLAPIMVLANQARALRAKYLSMTDTDSAVETYLADVPSHKDEEVAGSKGKNDTKDKTFGTLAAEIKAARNLIEKNEALMSAHATAKVQASIDPNFDEAVTKAEYNDRVAAIKFQYNDGIRSWFKSKGHLTSDTSPSGRDSNWRPASGYGQLLMEAYKLPKLDKESTGSTSATDPAVTAWNKAAKEWGKANGFTVKDKGALALDLREAYQKHLDSQK